MGNKISEPNINGRYNFERIVDGENNSSHNQVIGNNIDDKTRNAVNNAVFTVENCMHDAVLSAMDNVVIPRVQIAVKSITGSSGKGPSSIVQNPNRRDFTGNTENTPLISASSRLDLSVDQDRNVETHVENFQNGDFPVLRPNYHRRTHTHHSSFPSLITFLNEFGNFCKILHDQKILQGFYC